MQQAGESKAESSRSLSWCVAGTEEALTLWSWTSRGDYSQQNLSKMRWMEHFSEVLNRPPPPTEADIQEAETDLDVNTHPQEKKRSLQPSSPSRTEKSPGQDNLSAEVFKADPQLTTNLLQLLFTDIRKGKKLPEDWTDRVIVKILKKGALNNWQGITLLSVPGKILAKMKLTQWTNNWEESWQGFGKERDAHTRSSPCVTSWNSAQSGRDNSTSTF